MSSDASIAVEPAVWAAQTYSEPVRGPSYSNAFRYLAAAVVLFIAAAAWRTTGLQPREGDAASGLSLTIVVLAMMIVILAVLWRSVTTIDASGIRQSGGFVERRVAWNEIRAAHFLRIGLTPRLVVRAINGPVRVFYAGNAELREAFRVIGAAQRRE